jgi:hypothetical protein
MIIGCTTTGIVSTLPQGTYLVTDFGAAGDGLHDDTVAFQNALNAASETGGTVIVPVGDFRIEGTLYVPEDVTLEGQWRAPARFESSKGSRLLALSGKGDIDGLPFIRMNTDSVLKGLIIHYPEQIDANPPHPYPWTVRGSGDNCTILDVLMTNPYQAVDFGTHPCGRHYINRLYAQAIYRGIFVDKCFDVGRMENVHLWPFWSTEGPVRDFTMEHGIGLIFGRTDWEYVTNTFCIGYQTGFLFKEFSDGPGNVLVTQSGSDIGPVAVRVDRVQDHAGVTFSNCQMMATVEVGPENRGPVRFTSTGFWAVPETAEQARLAGTGHTFFVGCHFHDWDRAGTGAPCIRVESGGITVTGSDFMAEGKDQIVLEADVEAAVITSNRFRGGERIKNRAEGDVQIGLNAQR